MLPVLILDNNYIPINVLDATKVKLKLAKLLCRNNYKKENIHLEILEEYNSNMILFDIQMKIPSVIRTSKKKLQIKTNFKSTSHFSRKNIWLRDNGECAYCLTKISLNKMHWDHIIPKSLGGKATWDNIVCCCKLCNSKKSNKSLSESNLKLKKKPHTVIQTNLSSRAYKVSYYLNTGNYHKSWIPYIKSLPIKNNYPEPSLN